LSAYNYRDFWITPYKADSDDPKFDRQNIIIPEVIDDLKFDSVLEIGVGDGRLTKMVYLNHTPKKYDVLDINEFNLVEVKNKFPNVHTILADITNFRIQDKYDLIISCETLMHILPEHFQQVMDNICQASKQIINIDYSEDLQSSTLSTHNFLHDYEGAYIRNGFKVTKKRMGKQVLFHATR
jgi:SAM-dependent methyltransferase